MLENANTNYLPKLDRPLSLGVVGCGKISQIILPMLAPFGVRVVGLADANAAAAVELAAKIEGATALPDTRSLLLSSLIDAVLIATPPDTHLSLTKLCLEHGKAVICEKPFVLCQDEARMAVAAAEAHPGLRVACCSSRFRFTPHAHAAARLLAEGALGRLHSVRIFVSGPPPPPNDHLPPWKRSAATAGGGIFADWGGYELEWLRGVLGPAFDPAVVNAQLNHWRREGTDLESGYDAQIRCRSGLHDYRSLRRKSSPERAGPRESNSTKPELAEIYYLVPRAMVDPAKIPVRRSLVCPSA